MHPEVTRDPTLRIPVGEETVAATLFEPTTVGELLPAVLWATPYHKERERFVGYGPVLEYLAAEGYAVVLANLVGTGASTGRFQGLVTPETGRQCATMIEWLADREWTTDRVGMIGKSAAGYTCLETAAADPEPLQVAVPIMHPSRGDQAIYGPGGLFRLSGMLGWLSLYAVMAAQPSSRRDDAGRWRERWERRLDALREDGPARIGLPNVFADGREHDAVDHEVPVGEITVPTLAVGGFRDTFAPETLAYFRAIDAPKRLLLGPWRHVIPHRGRETATDFRRQAVDWFDQFLRGERRGVLEGPTITYWTERDGGRQVDGGTWRRREAWPAVDDATDTVRFAVTPGGLERDADPGHGDAGVERTHAFDGTVGAASMDFGTDFLDTAPDDARALTFESAPLETPVEWTGTGRATVQLASSTDEAALCVRIVDVGPDSRARPVTRGAQRLGEGPKAVPIEAGVSRGVSVGLRPASHVFETGHRIRLAIAAADFPRYLPVGRAGEFTVTSRADAPTTVAFPGRHSPPLPFDDAVDLAPPDDALPVTPDTVESQSVSGETRRAHHDGTTTVRRESSAEVAYPHVDRRVTMENEMTAAPEDPDSVVGEYRYETVLEHDAEPVTTTATCRITREELRLSLSVTVDGEPRFEETWTERAPEPPGRSEGGEPPR